LAFKLKNNFKSAFFPGKKGNIYICYDKNDSYEKSPSTNIFDGIGQGGGIY